MNEKDKVKITRNYVYGRIESLQSKTSATRSSLAKLRRGIGARPGELPELWQLTLERLPEELLSKGSEPTRGEWAVHIALTLYALHQQGKDDKKMSIENYTLGKALRAIADENTDEALKRRFITAATSDSMEEFSWHLRSLIQLLRAKDVPLDYPKLAEDIYWFQFPELRASLRLRWGQDYYGTIKQNENQEEKK